VFPTYSALNPGCPALYTTTVSVPRTPSVSSSRVETVFSSFLSGKRKMTPHCHSCPQPLQHHHTHFQAIRHHPPDPLRHATSSSESAISSSQKPKTRSPPRSRSPVRVYRALQSFFFSSQKTGAVWAVYICDVQQPMHLKQFEAVHGNEGHSQRQGRAFCTIR
jgi:hypothetical protein